MAFSRIEIAALASGYASPWFGTADAAGQRTDGGRAAPQVYADLDRPSGIADDPGERPAPERASQTVRAGRDFIFGSFCNPP
jgi:hypothetical protein